MADIAITAANVKPSVYASKRTGTAGATITAGQPVYKDATDGKYKLADANLSLAAAQVEGIAAHGAADGQPLTVVTEDPDFTFGGTSTQGAVLILSGTAGAVALCLDADLVTGMFPSVLGVLKTTTKVNLRITNGNGAHS